MAELLRLLGAAGAPEPEQVADALWLAEMVGPSALTGPVADAGPAPAVRDGAPATTAPAGPGTQPPRSLTATGPAPGVAALYLPPPGHDTGPPTGGPGTPLRVRAPAALPGHGALARALRPLTRWAPSGGVAALEVDEEATVERIVDTAQWSPVLRPAPSRWLDLVLVVDDSVSMMVWRDTVREFLSVLGSVGAFRSVQHWLLPTEEIPARGVVLRPPTAGQDDGRADRSPLEILDTTGRRVVLVASDCVSPSWADGTLGRLLRTWGQAGPVALVQLLPRRMWGQSALSVQDVRLGSQTPGTANARLAVTPLGGHRPAPRTMAVPVLELDPRWLGPWAALVSGETTVWDTVATLVPESADPAEVPGPRTAGPGGETPEELVRAFRGSASPAAQRLAAHLAAVPLSLPVMRLVQAAVLGDSPPWVLTEVLFRGLVTRADDAGSGPGARAVLFEFRPGVREILLQSARRTQILATMQQVSDWLVDEDRRSGRPAADFTALLRGDPDAVAAARRDRPFATVTAQTLRHLSAEYEALARRLEAPADDQVPDGPPGPAHQRPEPAAAPAVSGTVPPAAGSADQDATLLAEVHAGAFGTPQVLTAREGGGATTAAARYVALYGHAYDQVAWIPAGRPVTGPELPALLRAAEGRDSVTWLLVVDGARPGDGLPPDLPPGPGTLLLTAADNGGAWPPDHLPHHVPPFKRATAIRFLRDRVPDLTAPAALRIAARLDDVPLALAMAAGVLAGRTPEELLGALGADPGWGATPAAPLDDPVAEMCALAQDRAVGGCPAAAELLDLCAVLAHGPVPAQFLARALPETCGTALDALAGAALVTVVDGTVFVPAVVGRVRRERTDPARTAVAGRLARAAFVAWHAAERAPVPGDGFPGPGDGLAALTRHLDPMGALGDDDPAVREAVRDQVRLLAACGDGAGAAAWGALALDRLRSRTGQDGPGTAELAGLLNETAREDEAAGEAAAGDEAARDEAARDERPQGS
ncbi:SAV_2336 N-terminal domain-related protein [Streptomyces sp. NPDC004610]|uniref:SAV_2336 N-terminal domain-related protein n=1 Tax=unclassified Streptomyces TaxID=2593676 RepID=UPI0033B78902